MADLEEESHNRLAEVEERLEMAERLLRQQQDRRHGTSFLVLADVAYYLIFTAYILFNVQFSPGENWTATVGAEQLQDTVSSIAGICLIIGLLHGVNVFVLPCIGSVLALRKRLMEYQPKQKN